MFNEWYARDISKKRRISNKIKGNGGEPMGQPPYGYMKDPDNPKHWIVDDEAAQVVKHIYGMTLDGMGTEQIAAQLEREEILTPRAYWLKKGVKRPGKGKQQPPTKWNSSTVTKILSLQEYCGDILNFKTYSKSYKNKKRIENDRENWVVFKDVHEPIVDRAVWEQVQQKRGKVRKRRTIEGEKNMFSGLLVCADCGNNLHFHFNQGNPEIRYFNCSNYKGNRGTCTSTHYVRVDFLEQVVLGEIKRLTKFASRYEDDFVKAVMGSTQQNVALDRKLKEKELAALQARDEELDGLFERIYEDNVSGKLPDDRFAKMSRRYEDEQKEISEKIKALRAEMDKRGWSKVAALQLRNPMHRSHEYLAKIAIEVCDGVVIHSLVGNLKPGDTPAEVRIKCINTLVDKYFVKDFVIQAGYPLDMRYAGPREALLHATFRQNYGINRQIVGRDHAGVGDFYGMFEAQEIFDKIPQPAEEGKRLLCQPLKIDWTFYCHKCDGMASMRTCPHSKEDRVILSGTKLRKFLSEGKEVPDHFGRPEVLAILKDYYAHLQNKVEIKMQRAASGSTM